MAKESKKIGTANGKKRARQSPSDERLLALALVRVIECVLTVEQLGREIAAGDSTPEYEKALDDKKHSIEEAEKVLAGTGYGELESIATRVANIEADLKKAIDLKDGAKIAQLGAALDRAKTGKPPTSVAEKKPRKPREPKAPKQEKTEKIEAKTGAPPGPSATPLLESAASS